MKTMTKMTRTRARSQCCARVMSLGLVMGLLLGGCVTAPGSADQRSGLAPTFPQRPIVPPPGEPGPEPLTLQDRMMLAPPLNVEVAPAPEPLLYSFRAQDMDLGDALALFARSNQLNIVAGPEIEGTISVDFRNLVLDKAMNALLSANELYWVRDGDLMLVRRYETRTFSIDYIRLVRSGRGRSQAQVTAGANGGGEAGSVALEQEDDIKFWEELQEQIKVLMTEDGRLVVNRLSGTIQVTDLHERVTSIAEYIDDVRRALYRQVEIEARIYEVTLQDNYSLGINWDRIDFFGNDGLASLSNIITSPVGGFVAKTATTGVNFESGSFAGVLEALSEQGDLKVVSQPRIVTLNNQPALIKVATDQSFFIQTVVQGTAGSGNIVTEEIRSVTSGLVLSVTPQISADGWVMLDVSPIITRLTDIVTSQAGSTAPVLDVKQSSGLVRLRDGAMVVIGGLIQDQTSKTERKVPLLGDIPWLGALFRGTYEVTAKTELVIFISPHIVRTPQLPAAGLAS